MGRPSHGLSSRRHRSAARIRASPARPGSRDRHDEVEPRRPGRLGAVQVAARGGGILQPRAGRRARRSADVRQRDLERHLLAADEGLRAGAPASARGHGAPARDAGDASPGRSESHEAGLALRQARDRRCPRRRRAVHGEPDDARQGSLARRARGAGLGPRLGGGRAALVRRLARRAREVDAAVARDGDGELRVHAPPHLSAADERRPAQHDRPDGARQIPVARGDAARSAARESRSGASAAHPEGSGGFSQDVSGA